MNADDVIIVWLSTEKEEEAEEALPLTSEQSTAGGARAYQSNEPITPMPILQESSDSQRSPPNLDVHNSFRASNSLDPFEDGEADIACLSYPTNSHWLTKTRVSATNEGRQLEDVFIRKIPGAS